MFSKDKSREMDMPVVTKSASKDIKTLIGEGCKVEGNFFIPTYTRVDGTIKGDLTGDSGIVIGVNGTVEGNVFGTEIVVYGNIKGNVETQKLELKKGSALTGDIKVLQFTAEFGSSFNGRCTMTETPKYESVTQEQTETP
jgi:cytoskeletal protein CcmA (bactofilin family)